MHPNRVIQIPRTSDELYYHQFESCLCAFSKFVKYCIHTTTGRITYSFHPSLNECNHERYSTIIFVTVWIPRFSRKSKYNGWSQHHDRQLITWLNAMHAPVESVWNHTTVLINTLSIAPLYLVSCYHLNTTDRLLPSIGSIFKVQWQAF